MEGEGAEEKRGEVSGTQYYREWGGGVKGNREERGRRNFEGKGKKFGGERMEEE